MARELVERAISGDFEAFTDLVNASASRQYAIATLILRDGDRAKDAVQEALVAAWRGLSALRDPDAWDAWLHRLTVRACYAAVRREKRRTLVELPPLPDREPVVSTDESTALVERDGLERELGRLPIDQRAVLVLHFYVAECYWPGITVPGVTQTVQRVQRAAEALTVEGSEIRYVSAFVVPEDEIAFCLFDARSTKVVGEACRRADLPCDRILLVAQIPNERAC